MTDPRPSLAERKRAVLARVRLGELVERGGVTLSGHASSTQRRARCPFHQGNSASFAVVSKGKPEEAFAHCFGCQWHGNAIDYLAAERGLPWIEALAELELQEGLSERGASAEGQGPVVRPRNPAAPVIRRQGQWVPVDSLDAGRWMWRRARPDLVAIRTYFAGRGVPPRMLADHRFAQFRYLAECPAALWAAGSDPRKQIHNPAVIALVSEPRLLGDPPALEFIPVGVHVTYLNPAGDGTMIRRKPWAKSDDEDPMLPKRRMLGAVGKGAVFLGPYRPDARLWVGEGNETVLSAMALGDAGDGDVGVATLSLDNLQGHPKKWRGGVWPLHAIEPEPERGPFVVPGHRGAVVGLVDADMAPLKGPLDRRTGKPQGMKLVERKGGPIIDRAITGAERATICGALLVKGWRRAGISDVTALRAPAGMDFNDVVKGAGA